MKVAQAIGRLRGKQAALNHRQEAHLVVLLNSSLGYLVGYCAQDFEI